MIKYKKTIIVFVVGAVMIAYGFYFRSLSIMDYGKWVIVISVINYLLVSLGLDERFEKLQLFYDREFKKSISKTNKNHKKGNGNTDSLGFFAGSNSENNAHEYFDLSQEKHTKLALLRNEVKFLITKNRLEESLKKTKSYCELLERKELENVCTMLLSQMEDVKRIELMRTENSDQIRIEKNRIVERVLSIIQIK